MDRGAWQATVYGVAKELDRTEQLSSNRVESNLHSEVLEEHSARTCCIARGILSVVTAWTGGRLGEDGYMYLYG